MTPSRGARSASASADAAGAVDAGGHDARLVPPALASWATAFALAGRSDAATLAALLAGLAAALAAVALLARRRHRRVGDATGTRGSGARCPSGVSATIAVAAVCAGAVSLVAASTAAEAARSHPAPLTAAVADGGPVVLGGVVTGLVGAEAVAPVDAAAGADGGFGADARFRIRLGTLRSSADDAAVPLTGGEVLVFGTVETVDGAPPGIGARVEVEGRLRATEPGDDVAALVFADGPATVVSEPSGVLAWSNALRAGFVEAATTMPGDGAALLPGLAVGDTRLVSASLDADMKASSLAHLTAVSGSNCAIVVAGVLVLARAAGVRRGVRLAIAGLALAGFVLLVTPEGSVLRAAAMAGIVLAAGASGRRPVGLPLVSLAVVVLLAVEPSLARDLGFGLSVAATLGLVLLAGPLADRLAGFVPRPLAAAIAVPIAAQVCCQPLLILVQPSVPAHGVVANLLAAPAAPVATVLGLVACLLGVVVPGVATIVRWTAWLPSSWIAAVATSVASWPAGAWPWLPGPVGAVLLAALSAAVLALVLPARRPGVGDGSSEHRTPARTPARSRIRAGLAVVLAIVIVVWGGGVVGGEVRDALQRPGDWRYAACDVGQGDALLVRSAESVALIDTGPEPEAIDACLDRFGVERLDLLVLTHFDHDHDGAAGELLGRVAALAVPDTEEAARERIVDRFAESGAEIRRLAAGDAFAVGDAAWTVLWPPGDRRPTWREGNASSVVVRVDPPGGPSLVALGDLGAGEQRTLLDAAGAGGVAADVVKVSHHGSADQAPELYAAIGASVGLVSVGADNDYGHPTGEALGMLAAAGTRTVRTDERGSIAVSSAADGAIDLWSPERASSVGTVDRAGGRDAYDGRRRVVREEATWRHRDVPRPGRRSPRSRRSPYSARATCGPRRSCSSPVPRTTSRASRSIS